MTEIQLQIGISTVLAWADENILITGSENFCEPSKELERNQTWWLEVLPLAALSLKPIDIEGLLQKAQLNNIFSRVVVNISNMHNKYFWIVRFCQYLQHLWHSITVTWDKELNIICIFSGLPGSLVHFPEFPPTNLQQVQIEFLPTSLWIMEICQYGLGWQSGCVHK